VIGLVIAGVVILIAGVLIYCQWKKKRQEDQRVSLIREDEQSNDSFAFRPSFMQDVIKEKEPEYSDEERMRMERLMKNSLLSSE
jgi:hypothetical protein